MKFIDLGIYSYTHTDKERRKNEKNRKFGDGVLWALALDSMLIWLQENNHSLTS